MSSSRVSEVGVIPMADWFWPLLGISKPTEGQNFTMQSQPFVIRSGIPRSKRIHSAVQTQTEEAFAYKWKRRDTFDSEASRARMRHWLDERYGSVLKSGWLGGLEAPLVLDAGCGAALSALEYFAPVLDRIRYLGVDISDAVDVARQRLAERDQVGGFMQANITTLPFAQNTFDIIFAEGVLHHTDSTRDSFLALAPLLRRGGLLFAYVYRKKGPIREFSDDYIRMRLENMSPEEAWRAMEPLTRLGVELGRLDIELNIEEPIDLLDIPAGSISLQRFFYWHVAKTFFHREMSFDEMNHINFDWYAPKNAHRQTAEEVRAWCGEAGLDIERETIEEAGLTIVARRRK